MSACFECTFEICILLATLLDPPNGEEWEHTDATLKYGADMVRLIRKEFGDYFCICVAGMSLFFSFCFHIIFCVYYSRDYVQEFLKF